MLTTGRLRAVILNSGGANACTGPGGFQDTHATAEAVAAALSDWGTETGAIEVAVCSTGLIGDRLPMDKVLAGVTAIVHEMAGGLTGGEEAAQAIMTTDTVPKQVALHHADNWTVGGMAKGAGMLAPSLATMLCVITTDAVADADALDHALRQAAAARTFDRLDVDGSCSTNDTVLLLASGASEITPSQDDLDDAVLRGLRRPVRSVAGRRRGRHQARHRHGDRCRDRGRRRHRCPGHRPRQPGQDRAVRLRPELGPGAGRGRHGAGRRSIPIGSPCRSTVLRSASTASVRPAPATSTCPVPRSPSPSTSGSATRRRRIRTTDLSHAYVEENSAYSS